MRRTNAHVELVTWQLSPSSAARNQTETFDNGIVQARPDFADLYIFSRGKNAIGEQNHKKILFRIDPQRCSRESIVAVTFCREIFSGGGWLKRHVPPESPCRITDFDAGGEVFDGL